jgi:hypothetical protein
MRVDENQPRTRALGAFLLSSVVTIGLIALLVTWAAGDDSPRSRGEGEGVTSLAPGSCGPELEDGSLVAQRDGVRLEVSVDTDSVVFAQLPSIGLPFENVMYPVPAGTSEVVLPIPPGRALVGCFPAPFDPAYVAGTDLRSVEVLDPTGDWVPLPSACTMGSGEDWQRVRTTDWPRSVTAASEDLPGTVAASIGADRDDLATIVGYPGSSNARFILVTEDALMSVIDLASILEISNGDTYTIPPYLHVLECNSQPSS